MQESTEAPRLPNSDRADMNDIIDHLNARADEDERDAKDAADGAAPDWEPGDENLTYAVLERDGDAVVIGPYEYLDGGVRRHIARHDPSRVLADVEVIRQVINDYRVADGACIRGDAGSPEYATIRAGRDAFKSVLMAYAKASGWTPRA